MKDTKSRCTQHQCTLKPRTSQYPLLMYKSEAHQWLSKQVAQEAHAEKEEPSRTLPLEVMHTVAALCLHKPWRQLWRSSLKPLYLETMMTLPRERSMRTLTISETPSTSLSDEHWEDQEAQGAQEVQEDPTTHMEDLTTQEQYLPLILFLYSLPET